MATTHTNPTIYLGFWTNWSYGKVLGSTLTLSKNNGLLLTAFLALYVRVAGGHLWNIVCFIIFLSRSSSEPRSGLFHQQQALLRSKPSDLAFAWQSFRISWEWRKVTRRAMIKSLPLTLLTLLYTMCFAAAGILSSRVTSTSLSEVLLKEVSCGSFSDLYLHHNYSTPAEMAAAANYGVRVRRNFKAGSMLGRSCYGTSPYNVSFQDCDVLGRQQIQWTNESTLCPFGGDICKTSAIRFDTGPIDSHLQLGINAPREDRVSYQRIMECAPLKTSGFVRSANASDLGLTGSGYNDTHQFLVYSYGSTDSYGPIASGASEAIPATFYYDQQSSLYLQFLSLDTPSLDQMPYRIA